MIIALVCVTPIVARAQRRTANGEAGEQSKTWIVLGGTSTTLRGDCQEDCVAHGTGDYLHTGSFIAMAGARLNRKMDAGAEVSWVPATARDGSDVRSTFLLAAAQFRPWESQGFFLKGAMGMAFVRNFIYDGTGTLPPITSKALGLSYAAGWAFRRNRSRRLRDVRRAARGRARRLPNRRDHRDGRHRELLVGRRRDRDPLVGSGGVDGRVRDAASTLWDAARRRAARRHGRIRFAGNSRRTRDRATPPC